MAVFPNVRGWSAEDVARRAGGERGARFRESLREGSPELALTAAGAVQHA